MPAHLRRAQNRNVIRIPTKPFSPNGLVRDRNGVLLLRVGVLAGLAFCLVRRYMRKRDDFPNLSRLQMVTGWVVCRVWCINAEKVVVRICYGRGCWQAVGLPGLVAQTGTGVLSQAVRSAGKNRIKNTSIKHLQICIVRQILSRFFLTYPNIPHGTISWHGVFLDSKCIAQLLAHDSLNMKKPHNPPAIGIGI